MYGITCRIVKCEYCGEFIYEEGTAFLNEDETLAFCCPECFEGYYSDKGEMGSHVCKKVIIDSYHNQKLNWIGNEDEE